MLYSASPDDCARPRPTPPLFVAVGDNPARAFGMDARRPRRRARGQGRDGARRRGRPTAARRVFADLDFAWDPAWADGDCAAPGKRADKDGRAVLAHVRAGRGQGAGDRGDAAKAIGAEPEDSGCELLDAETAEFSYHELRKRDRPFVHAARSRATRRPVERAAYDATYKGVTDVLTLYLWRQPGLLPDPLGGARRADARTW